MINKNMIDYSVYLVTDTGMCSRENLIAVCEKAIDGGATVIQLREKDISSKDFYAEAVALKKLCDRREVPLLINDRADIALAVDADGIHIGNGDIPLEAARQILGDDKIIGYSAGSVSEAIYAEKNGADYLGVGAVFPTSTKDDAENIGIDMLCKVRKAVNIPIVGIGGINGDNIDLLYGTGIDGVAVVSCIMASDDPKAAAAILKKKAKNL